MACCGGPESYKNFGNVNKKIEQYGFKKYFFTTLIIIGSVFMFNLLRKLIF
jgi:hypothetical protein